MPRYQIIRAGASIHIAIEFTCVHLFVSGNGLVEPHKQVDGMYSSGVEAVVEGHKMLLHQYMLAPGDIVREVPDAT
jgi:hypothetical protein